MDNSQEYFMKLALKEAKKAERIEEVPVGAVIVKKGEVIAKAHNLREKRQSSLAHAELIAIEKACKKIGSWRLEECDLYVTLEPCPMCAGAIIQSRLRNVYFGAADPKAGCVHSVLRLFDYPFNHKPQVVSNVLAEESSQMLKAFFKALRR